MLPDRNLPDYPRATNYYDPPSNLSKTIAQADYKLIVDTSVKIIATRFTIEKVENGSVHILISQKQPAVINLDNLILKCLDEPDRKEWPTIIQTHFNSLFTSFDQEKKLDPTNYEAMKKYLSIRIYPQETVKFRGGTDSLVWRTDLDGTYTLLMIDLPKAFTPVSKSIFDQWGKTAEEVFQIAQVNVNNTKVKKVTKSFTVNHDSVEVEILGEENYAASYALDLQNNSPELLGEWGCAIALPNKGLVTICKIGRDKPIDFVTFIQATHPFIEKSYQDHPQPISDQYFWYYKGKFTPINIQTGANGQFNVIAPAGLSELILQKP